MYLLLLIIVLRMGDPGELGHRVAKATPYTIIFLKNTTIYDTSSYNLVNTDESIMSCLKFKIYTFIFIFSLSSLYLFLNILSLFLSSPPDFLK